MGWDAPALQGGFLDALTFHKSLVMTSTHKHYLAHGEMTAMNFKEKHIMT